jgi:hypothetical protein
MKTFQRWSRNLLDQREYSSTTIKVKRIVLSTMSQMILTNSLIICRMVTQEWSRKILATTTEAIWVAERILKMRMII